VRESLQIEQAKALDWLQSSAGQTFLAAEQRLIDACQHNVYGMRLLQMSIQDNELHESSPVHHRFALGLRSEAAICDYSALPLDQNSVDVVILHHVLEFSADPHAILREVARVVRPEGRVIVAVFNPWSVLNLQQMVTQAFSDRAWRAQNIGGHKLGDWLRLLDFEVNSSDYCWYSPAISSGPTLERLLRLEKPAHRFLRPFGASSIVSATKRVTTFTPTRRRWREQLPGAIPVRQPIALKQKRIHDRFQ
jgi:SAM-dependent methyltransferase